MENIPSYISIVFILTTFLTIGIFYKTTNDSKTTFIILLSWIVLQAIIALSGFYTITNTLPPRFLLLVLPPMFFIVGLFTTKKGKQYIDGLDSKYLILLHTVRIPVELVLFWLFLNKAVPELMTFEGRNFDILSGISAFVIFYFGYYKKQMHKNILLLWNFLCLGLLINIVVNAVLSSPVPFQQFAFDQPNIAVLYFPFIWLPSCIVPLVLLSHLVVIRRLVKNS